MISQEQEYTTEDNLAARVESLWDASEEHVSKFMKQWYINDNFYHGNHFVWWRKSTGTIDRVAPAKGSVYRVIQKATRQIESTTNMILANDPRWVVYPLDGSDEATRDANRLGHFLEYKYDELKMGALLYEVVLNALIYPVSFLEIGFDDDVTLDVWDAFDIKLEPGANSLKESSYLIKAVPRRIRDLQKNSNYINTENLSADNKLAASDLKHAIISDKTEAAKRINKDIDKVILKEAYIKVDTDDGTRIRILTTAGGKLLRDELTELTSFPFVMFKPRPGPIYQEAWMERFISPNKSLDIMVSNIENYMNVMVRGRYLQRRGQYMSRITNENGQIIEFDGAPPEALQIPSIPQFVFMHMANLEKWMEEQGVSSAAMGRVPRGVKAWRAIETLKASDYANMSAAVVALEVFLEKVAEKIMDVCSEHYDTARTVTKIGEAGSPDYFDVIGETGVGIMKKINEDYEPSSVVISKKYRVKVEIESAISHTEMGKREQLKELFQLGLIPPELLLQSYKFSNVKEILQKAEDYEAKKSKISMLDTQDFNILPDDIKMAALEYLQSLEAQGSNPLAMERPPETTTKGGQP